MTLKFSKPHWDADTWEHNQLTRLKICPAYGFLFRMCLIASFYTFIL